MIIISNNVSYRSEIMEKTKYTGRIYCLISAVIIIGCYAAQKILSLTAEPSRTLVLLEAMAFSLAVAVVYFLVTKSKEPFYGILISLLGLRMLPPSIGALREFSPGGYIVYYIVTKAALVIFAFAIIKLFRQQKSGNPKLKVLPILYLIVAVPFVNEISSTICAFVNGYANGNMLYAYFISFALYALVMLVTLWYAAKSDRINAKLLCDYTVIALLVNLARRAGIVLIYAVEGYHISRSYYCWIAIYVFFLAAFMLLKKKKAA